MHKIRTISLLLTLLLIAGLANAQESGAVEVITLERTACYGTCPIYSLSIYDDGTVIYRGEEHVEVSGEQISQIDPEIVSSMVESFVDAGYFEWDEAYTNQTISDMPGVITSVTFEGETHQITRNGGDPTAPRLLPYLELYIDRMVNAGLWTGNTTGIEFAASGEQSPIITLSAGACFGFCPVYEVALFEDGTIIYIGIANVETKGVQLISQSPLSVVSLADRASLTGYFDWEESYEQRLITDQVTVITTVSWNEQYKRIVRYDGDPSAPIGLVRFEDSISQLISELVGSI